MNCKPGDLAIVIQSGIPQNIGSIVHVLYAGVMGTDDPDADDGWWEVRLTASMICDPGGIIQPAGSEVLCHDSCLKPIRGQQAPQAVTTEVPREVVTA